MNKSPDGLYAGSLRVRLHTLSELVREHPRESRNGEINLHIHTNESFSVFRSPTEAVWYAYKAGIEYFGINDHYTIDGHREFREACRIAGLKAGFSIEAIALDEQAFGKGWRINDPDNPGRMYIVGKGVTRNLKQGGKGYRTFQRMREAIQRRNRKIVDRLNSYCTAKGFMLDLRYRDVIKLTPRGNATERHVVQAFCEKVDSRSKDVDRRVEIYSTLLSTPLNRETTDDPHKLLTAVRSKLIKSGMPCYVEEKKEAYTSIKNLVDIFLEYGAVPTYPVLAHPVTEEEEDLEGLVGKLKELGMYAFDVIDLRTERARAKEVLSQASRHGFPVFIGTEHNTKKLLPLSGDIEKDPEFHDYFKKSAQFLLGHQLLSKLCHYGYVADNGKPRIDDLHQGFQLFSEIGAMDLSEEKIGELKKLKTEERRKFFGIG
jgi:hypothetical protein